MLWGTSLELLRRQGPRALASENLRGEGGERLFRAEEPLHCPTVRWALFAGTVCSIMAIGQDAVPSPPPLSTCLGQKLVSAEGSGLACRWAGIHR